ncbi:MAG TPA: hypothetical protein VEA78_05950 [Acidimicrobiales bacterium]|nr:hypothetical protein [Acidimicrobiales bacterium]
MATGPPLRAVVVGNSVSVLCRPHEAGGPGTYAAALGDACRSRGVAVEVWNQGRWFEMVDTCRRRWDRDVSPFLPDVLIVNYGAAECQPWVAPHLVHRMLLDWKTRTTRASEVGRRALVAPGRAYLARMTPTICRLVGQRGHKMRPRRFEEEVRRLIRTTRGELDAGVLVLGMGPPGPKLERFMPGFGERCQRYDALLQQVVASFDDDRVQHVDVVPLYERLGAEAMSFDGLHYTPDGHRAVAELLAERVPGVLPARCG